MQFVIRCFPSQSSKIDVVVLSFVTRSSLSVAGCHRCGTNVPEQGKIKLLWDDWIRRWGIEDEHPWLRMAALNLGELQVAAGNPFVVLQPRIVTLTRVELNHWKLLLLFSRWQYRGCMRSIVLCVVLFGCFLDLTFVWFWSCLWKEGTLTAEHDEQMPVH